MRAWLYSAVKLTLDLVYVSVLLWMAASLLGALGLLPTYVIFVENPRP